jgi:hypothetical protein
MTGNGWTAHPAHPRLEMMCTTWRRRRRRSRATSSTHTVASDAAVHSANHANGTPTQNISAHSLSMTTALDIPTPPTTTFVATSGSPLRSPPLALRVPSHRRSHLTAATLLSPRAPPLQQGMWAGCLTQCNLGDRTHHITTNHPHCIYLTPILDGSMRQRQFATMADGSTRRWQQHTTMAAVHDDSSSARWQGNSIVSSAARATSSSGLAWAQRWAAMMAHAGAWWHPRIRTLSCACASTHTEDCVDAHEVSTRRARILAAVKRRCGGATPCHTAVGYGVYLTQ